MELKIEIEQTNPQGDHQKSRQRSDWPKRKL